jgi:hypothetical protein
MFVDHRMTNAYNVTESNLTAPTYHILLNCVNQDELENSDEALDCIFKIAPRI